MKKNVFISFLVFSLATLAFAQSDLQVIAKVNYFKNEPITLGQLKKFVTGFEAQARRKLTVDERLEVLNALIGKRLLVQAAEKSGVKALNSEVNSYFDGFLSQNIGKPVTEMQFAKMIKQEYNQSLDEYFRKTEGMSIKEIKDMIREQIQVQKYVSSKKRAEIQRMSIPTDGDIRKQYEMNKQQFFRPDMLKLLVVGVLKKGNDSAELKLINDLRNKAIKNKKNIAKIQKDGNSGKYIAQTRYALKNAVGAQALGLQIEALMQIFDKPINYVSEVTDMPDNRQFYVILEKHDAKLLALSDLYDPNQAVTIYEAIKRSLAQQMTAMALQQANQVLIKELKTDNNCKILLSDAKLKKVLNW